MAKISITQASKDFGVSRNTLYKKVRQGLLTQDSEGLLDVNDLIRVIGSQAKKSISDDTMNTENVNSVNRGLQHEIEQLKQLLAMKEILINQLQQQVSDLRLDKEQLYNQINQKRIEHKPDNRKGLLGRFFG
jgi:chromosome segregation ATPase